ncbi:MAG: helical backbone metal receptor [Bacteroidota bacterium]
MERVIQDQLGRTLEIPKNLYRIVSLVPSQTELLIDLGLENRLVGITKFCVHPANLSKTKTVVGGTKTVHYEKIADLQPDIILCNKEENTKEIVATLEKKHRVHVSNITNLEDSLKLIKQYGELFQCNERAKEINATIVTEAKTFATYVKDTPKLNVLYFIWKDPWMSVGKDTFIHHMLTLNGFINLMSEKERYPEVRVNKLSKISPDLILLSSEPFPFKEKHKEEIQLLCPDAEVLLVNGAYFSWYGSRLQKAFQYFKSLHKA